jgi:hypothetical protein
MRAEVDADLRDAWPSGEEDVANFQELYGLALRMLPPALVMALSEPLLLQSDPLAPRIVFPMRVPSWWHVRPLRRSPRAQGIRNSGTSTK